MPDEQIIETTDVADAAQVIEPVYSDLALEDDDGYPLIFRVLPPNSEWIADGQVFSANQEEHRVSDPDAALLRAAGSAHSAEVIEVRKGLDVSHVESQEDSEANLIEAMGQWVEPTTRADGTTEPGYWTGPWLEGHIMNIQKPGRIHVPVEADEEA